MALIGTVDTLLKQSDLSKFEVALNYLKNTDLDEVFTNSSPGHNFTVELDGKNLFAIFQTYVGKSAESAKMEGHQRYIDIQYIHSGKELILMSPLHEITTNSLYAEERDIYFPETNNFSTLLLTKGMAAILYPDDLHAPGIAAEDDGQLIQKIVFKVKI